MGKGNSWIFYSVQFTWKGLAEQGRKRLLVLPICQVSANVLMEETFSLSWDCSGFPFWLLLSLNQQQAAILMAAQVPWATAWRTNSQKRQIHMIISSNRWRSQRNTWNIRKKNSKAKKPPKQQKIKTKPKIPTKPNKNQPNQIKQTNKQKLEALIAT